MKVGVNLLLSNMNDTQSDQELWREHMRLADMVEPLGFDSLWGWNTTSPTTSSPPTFCKC